MTGAAELGEQTQKHPFRHETGYFCVCSPFNRTGRVADQGRDYQRRYPLWRKVSRHSGVKAKTGAVMSQYLTGKVIIVTGAASGFGN